MTLYQVFKNDKMIADKVDINTARSFVPVGSKIVGGNHTRTVRTPTGLKEVSEVRVLFQTPCNGPKYSIIQI